MIELIEKSLNNMSLKDREIQAKLNILHGVKLAQFDNFYVMKFESYELVYVIKLNDFTFRVFNSKESAIDYTLDAYNASGSQTELKLV